MMVVVRGGSKRWFCLAVAAAAIASGARAQVSQCNEGFKGDGDCDRQNNSEECDYDGGDCCVCTCVSTERYACEDTTFACIDPAAVDCVDDDDITVDNADCIMSVVGDSVCDERNNKAACDYDGGDCCPCTCFDDTLCGTQRDFNGGGYDCVDPSANCDDDEDYGDEDDDDNEDDDDDDETGCNDETLGDSVCDAENNNETCGYDGGDCCICTCFVSPTEACGEDGDYDCIAPSVSCLAEEEDDDASTDDYEVEDDDDDDDDGGAVPFVEDDDDDDEEDDIVEVGTKTGVSVAATAYDTRPGRSSDDVGCGEEGEGGCLPILARDGEVDEIESRWSCATKIVDGGAPCEIEFVFDKPQDIVDIEVAFWKGDQRTRTLEVKLNGELTHTHESYAGETFNTLGVEADDVDTVTLASILLEPDEWISLIEVVILVKG